MYVRPQAWWTPIGLLAVIGPSRKLQCGPPAFWARSRAKVRRSRHCGEDLVLLGDEVGLRADGSEHSASWSGGRRAGARRAGRARLPNSAGPSILPAMHRPQGARPRARSPFAAAFLSLLFPGLGQRMPARRCGPWRSPPPPILLIALVGRASCCGSTGSSSSAWCFSPWLLSAVFVVNIVVLVYRLVAIVDAYRVAEYLNAVRGLAATAGWAGPHRRATRCRSPGSLAVVLVMAGSHVVVARYDMLALESSTAAASSSATTTDECAPTRSRRPRRRHGEPGRVGRADRAARARATPVGSAVPDVAVPPWDGQERLNILLIGADERPASGPTTPTR